MNDNLIPIAGRLGDAEASSLAPFTLVTLDVVSPEIGNLISVAGNPVPRRTTWTTDSNGQLDWNGANVIATDSIFPGGAQYKITISYPTDMPSVVLGPFTLTPEILSEIGTYAGTASLGGLITNMLVAKNGTQQYPSIPSGKMVKCYTPNQISDPQPGDSCIVVTDSTVYVYTNGWNCVQVSGPAPIIPPLQVIGDGTLGAADGYGNRRLTNTQLSGTGTTGAFLNFNDTGILNMLGGGGNLNRAVSSICNVGWGAAHFNNTASAVFGTANYSMGNVTCNTIGKLIPGNVYRRRMRGYMDPNVPANNLNVNVTVGDSNIGSPYGVNIPNNAGSTLVEFEATLVITGSNPDGSINYCHFGSVSITQPNAATNSISLVNFQGVSHTSDSGAGFGWAFYGYFSNNLSYLHLCTDITEILVGS